MMNFINEKFKTFSKNQKLLLLGVGSLFFPMEISAVILVALDLYWAYKKVIFSAMNEQKGRIPFYLFVAISILISFIYGNLVGLMNAGGFLLIGAFCAMYRKEITPNLFWAIVYLCLVMSIGVAFLGFYQFNVISHANGHTFWQLYIENSPKKRITGTFFNANIYAMMLDYLIAMAGLVFFGRKDIKSRIFAVITVIFNFFALYLTGCRSALGPLVFFPLVFFWFNRKKIYFWIMLLIEGTGMGLLISNPSIIPRFNDLKTINSRILIWETAIKAFKNHPLLGMGPQTYGFVYKSLNGKKAPHAHNMILDSFVSFGIINTLVLGWYILIILKENWDIRKKSHTIPYYYALILCMLITIIVMGIVDVTTNFISTGCLTMLLLNSSCMFEKTAGQKREYSLK